MEILVCSHFEVLFVFKFEIPYQWLCFKQGRNANNGITESYTQRQVNTICTSFNYNQFTCIQSNQTHTQSMDNGQDPIPSIRSPHTIQSQYPMTPHNINQCLPNTTPRQKLPCSVQRQNCFIHSFQSPQSIQPNPIRVISTSTTNPIRDDYVYFNDANDSYTTFHNIHSYVYLYMNT